jgi:hypothetical protein
VTGAGGRWSAQEWGIIGSASELEPRNTTVTVELLNKGPSHRLERRGTTTRRTWRYFTTMFVDDWESLES